MNEERRYTLEEAKLELARQACATEGHYFEVISVQGVNEPNHVHCYRCDATWAVISHREQGIGR